MWQLYPEARRKTIDRPNQSPNLLQSIGSVINHSNNSFNNIRTSYPSSGSLEQPSPLSKRDCLCHNVNDTPYNTKQVTSKPIHKFHPTCSSCNCNHFFLQSFASLGCSDNSWQLRERGTISIERKCYASWQIWHVLLV